MYDFTLTPAYGRDYKSKKAVLVDLYAPKDFIMQPQGRYCSVRDFPNGTALKIRYGKMRKVMIHIVSRLN